MSVNPERAEVGPEKSDVQTNIYPVEVIKRFLMIHIKKLFNDTHFGQVCILYFLGTIPRTLTISKAVPLTKILGCFILVFIYMRQLFSVFGELRINLSDAIQP